MTHSCRAAGFLNYNTLTTFHIMRNFLFFAFFSGILMSQIACNKGGNAIKTRHGHMFTNHTNGTTPKAQSGEMVTVNVYTWLNDSLVSSTVRDMGGPREVMLPDSAQLTERAPAVFDAIFLMTKGDSATLIQTVDSVMAKGIPKNFGTVKEIRYEIVLVDQLDKAAVQKKMEAEQQKAEVARGVGVEVDKTLHATLADYKAHKLGSKLQKTASGLEYIIYEKGNGAPLQKGEKIPTNYLGLLQKDGQVFDGSYDRGGPQPFQVGGMIPGFDEGLLLLNHGGKAVFFIPSALAYGEKGIPNSPIGPNSDLVFYVEVE